MLFIAGRNVKTGSGAIVNRILSVSNCILPTTKSAEKVRKVEFLEMSFFWNFLRNATITCWATCAVANDKTCKELSFGVVLIYSICENFVCSSCHSYQNRLHQTWKDNSASSRLLPPFQGLLAKFPANWQVLTLLYLTLLAIWILYSNRFRSKCIIVSIWDIGVAMAAIIFYVRTKGFRATVPCSAKLFISFIKCPYICKKI